ncbi:MAG: bifunctional serine/threonine-protein kinase/formylglycine-generating enzyme family protein [Pyrinomonadaceae bacterium]
MREALDDLAATKGRRVPGIIQPADESTKELRSPADSHFDIQRIEMRRVFSLTDDSQLVLGERYQLEEQLGFGGMGAVYKARHILLKSTHAVKIIFADLVDKDPDLVRRFRQEAIATAAIRHPNVVAVTDFGVASGNLPFLVMNYIQGQTLQSYLEEKGRLHPTQALEIMSAICAGVGAAHRLGIVHRDLKPLNIMLAEGLPVSEAVRVLDFGLAKIKSGELLGSLVQAQSSGFMGSPFYMAPEQWSDEEPDARADIYSLGIILYQMLTGDVPFKGPSIPAIMKKHLLSSPPAMDMFDGRASAPVEAVVRRALEKHPEDRIQSVEDFLNQLRQAIGATKATQAFHPVPRKAEADETAAAGSDNSHRAGLRTVKDGFSQGDQATQPHAWRGSAAVDQQQSLAPRRGILSAKVGLSKFKMCTLGVAFILSVAAIAGLLYKLFPGNSAQPHASETSTVTLNKASAATLLPPVPTVAPQPARAILPSHMIYIPSGVYMMGRAAAGANQKLTNQWPAHQVIVNHFVIDKTEITNDEYAAFVRETGYQPPPTWQQNGPPEGAGQWPATNVTLADINAFAAWRSRRDGISYRLPTEAQWEYVARSCSEELPYPWGASWIRHGANVGASSLKPVGSFPAGASSRGVVDLIGNAWEWTSTEASFYEGNDHVLPEKEQGWMVVRGGSFKTSADSVTSTTRGWVPSSTKDPTLGFRLVAPAL